MSDYFITLQIIKQSLQMRALVAVASENWMQFSLQFCVTRIDSAAIFVCLFVLYP